MSEIQISPFFIKDGVTLHYIKDEKYKTNYLNFYFSLPLTAENATKSALLVKVLKRGCTKFPTMGDLNSALEMNYSSGLIFSSFKQGEKTVLSISLSTLKNRYAPLGEDIFADGVDILFEMLFAPLLEGDEFKSEYFESEKRNLKDQILAQINNKALYARTRFVAQMCQGEAFAVNGDGEIDALDRITSKELYAFLQEIIKTAVCDIYFVGSENESRVKELLSTPFTSFERKDLPRPKTQIIYEKSNKDITERLDIAQAHLFIGYRMPVTYSSPDYLKFVLFNMVLGGDVSSKMFMNIREKLSLCYTCYSSCDATKGIFFAYAGIAPENKEKAMSAFYTELENIRAGKVSETELDDAKKAYINRMREIVDNPSLLPMWFHIRLESGVDTSPLKDAESISKLTLDDVVWAAKQILPDTVYFLTSEKSEA